MKYLVVLAAAIAFTSPALGKTHHKHRHDTIRNYAGVYAQATAPEALVVRYSYITNYAVEGPDGITHRQDGFNR